jgi:hypothetical protein
MTVVTETPPRMILERICPQVISLADTCGLTTQVAWSASRRAHCDPAADPPSPRSSVPALSSASRRAALAATSMGMAVVSCLPSGLTTDGHRLCGGNAAPWQNHHAASVTLAR